MALSVKSIGTVGYQTTIEDDRMLTAALFEKETGRLLPTDFALTPSDPGAGFALNIGPGGIVLEGSETNSEGAYFVWDTVAQDLPWEPSAVLPRVDSLLLVVADSEFGAPTVGDGPQWVIATGTPASSPVALSDSEIDASWSQPGAWVRVADLDVPAGATSFITNNIHSRIATVQSRRMISMIREGQYIWPLNSSLTYVTTTERLVGSTPNAAESGRRLQKTFTVKTGRCYRIRASGLLDGDSNALAGRPTAELRIRYASGSAVTTAGTLIANGRGVLLGDSNVTNPAIQAEGYMNGLTPGTYTVGTFLIANTGSPQPGARLFAPWQMTIEDVGPTVDESYT